MSGSLKEQWGLNEPDGGNEDDQSNEFRDAYHEAIEPIVAILQSLTKDGSPAVVGELTDLLDQAYADYQAIIKGLHHGNSLQTKGQRPLDHSVV